MRITQSQGAMIDLSPIYDALLESPLRREIDTERSDEFLQLLGELVERCSSGNMRHTFNLFSWVGETTTRINEKFYVTTLSLRYREMVP